MSRLDRRQGECMMCLQPKPIRNIDLYIIGSEGFNCCHDCEMNLVHSIQAIRSIAAGVKRQTYLNIKKGE